MKDGPRRTCIGCRRVKPKAELMRLVRGGDGRVAVDRERAAGGRGAYACPTAECLDKALVAGRLARAFRATVWRPCQSAGEIVESWQRR